jgi:uncharacterized membrane protein YdbT with pleckstrin-like domain
MRLFNRIFGVKPGRDAPRLERLRWFRGYYLRNLPLTALAVAALALLLKPSQLWIAAVIMLPWTAGFTRLNVEIRNEERRPDS